MGPLGWCAWCLTIGQEVWAAQSVPPLLPVLLLMPPSEPPLQLEPQCYNMSSHTIGASATTCQCPPVVLVSGLHSVPFLLATMLKLVPLRLCTAESATICYCTALLPMVVLQQPGNWTLKEINICGLQCCMDFLMKDQPACAKIFGLLWLNFKKSPVEALWPHPEVEAGMSKHVNFCHTSC